MKQVLMLMMVLLVLPLAAAHTDEDFEIAKQLIDDDVPCSNLSDEQLEMIGDYYMEQMHPGELHEVMDERMGGEGSESLRLVHIQMAQNLYCNDAAGYGMMGGGFGSRMFDGMRGPMVGWGGMMGGSMMGSYYGQSATYQSAVWLLIIALLAVIAWQLWKAAQPKRRKRKV